MTDGDNANHDYLLVIVAMALAALCLVIAFYCGRHAGIVYALTEVCKR